MYLIDRFALDGLKKMYKFYDVKGSFLYFLLSLLVFSYGCVREVKQNGEIRVARINFEGNHFVSDNKLREVLPVKRGDVYVEQFAREGPNRIVDYYRGRGFFDMRVIKREGEFIEEENEIMINYHIFEGVRSRIDSVNILGNTLFSDKYIKRELSIEEGSYYDETSIDAGKYSLSRKYAEKGFADVSILTERSFLSGKGRKSIFLKLTIKEGEKIYVREVEIEGLKEVRRKVAMRELRIKKGDLYKPSKVYNSQSNLYRTEVFSDIKVQEEKVKDDSVDITFILKEEKSRFFQIGFGYESPRKAIFDFRWGDLDLFGNLQRLTLDLSFKGSPYITESEGLLFREWEENYSLTYKEPYFLGSRFNTIVSTALERRKSESDFSFEFVLERELSPFSVISFPYEFRRSSLKPDTSSITNSVSGRFLLDERNDVLNPSKGVRFLFQYGYAGRILGGDNHFDRLNLDFAFYYSLPFNAIFAQRSKAVITFPKESADDITPDVRLEMGGYGSLRGFKEASLGFPDARPNRKSGLDELLFNFELRVPVYNRLYGIIFADFGSLWMDYNEMSLADLHTGVGFGIGYKSPIGVIRLDYARATEEISSDYNGKIYLNFGHPF